MTLFTDISKLHTFSGFFAKDGRRPLPEDVSTVAMAAMLVAKSGDIEWAGTVAEWSAFAKTKSSTWRKKIRKISLQHREVLPAFSECHTHLLYAGSRADEFERRNRGDSYLSIAEAGGGIRSTVKATANASLKELEVGVVRRLKDFARQGVTTVEIKTGYAATIEEEKRHLELLFKLQKKTDMLKLPRIVVTCLAAHSIPDGATETTWLQKIPALFPLLKKHSARLDIFIEKGAFSMAHGGKLMEQAVEYGLSIVIHADQLSLSGGTALGARLKARSVDHVIEAGPKEIELLAKSGTVAVLLPAADLYTRLAYPKARAMIDGGVRVGLATDHNPGSSPGLDVALVGVLARAAMQMTLPEVLASYTVNAASALGYSEKLGVLRKGMSADFLVLEKGKTLTDLFYAVGPTLSHACVSETWRGGNQICKSKSHSK